MGKFFEPIKDLFGAVYDLIYDAATKVWALAKPILLVGLVFDLVTARLGWISQILDVYHRLLEYTAGASWVVVVAIALVFVSLFYKK